jgi:hypothetical protein
MAEKSLELRINSLDDAKACVQQSPKICKTCEALGLESIELFIAEEIIKEVEGFFAGVFSKKVFWKIVGPTPGNQLYRFNHFQPATHVPIRSLPQVSTPVTNGNGHSKTTQAEINAIDRRPLSKNGKRLGAPSKAVRELTAQL